MKPDTVITVNVAIRHAPENPDNLCYVRVGNSPEVLMSWASAEENYGLKRERFGPLGLSESDTRSIVTGAPLSYELRTPWERAQAALISECIKSIKKWDNDEE